MEPLRIKYIAVVLLIVSKNIFVDGIRIDLTTQVVENVIELMEGEPLKIICRGVESAELSYPEPIIGFSQRSNRVFSETNVLNSTSHRRKKFKSKLEKKKTLHGDTGLYTCRNSDITLPNWIYIFVKSNNSLFVEDIILPEEKFVINKRLDKLRVAEECGLWLSCQPTYSTTFVDIYKNGEKIKVNEDPHTSYTYVEEPSAGSYECKLKNDDEDIIGVKKYNVTEVYEDPILIISENESVNVTKGQPFRMNCTAMEDSCVSSHLRLGWIHKDIPVSKNDSQITVKKYRFYHPSILNYRYIIKELNISEVTDDHMGEYHCSLIHFDVFGDQIINTTKTVRLMVQDPVVLSMNQTFSL